jgi:hypothetical protein
MIDYNKKFLFIHIPKTGGTSIENLLHPNEEIYSRPAEDHRAEHLRYNDYSKIINKNGFDINEFYIFSFVRNPYSKIYSFWKFLSVSYKQKHSIHFNAMNAFNIADCLKDFRSFVDCVYDSQINFDRININPKDAYLAYVFVTQCEWLYDLKKINFIGRFERLNLDFSLVYKNLFGNNFHDELPKLNKTTESSVEYLDFYDTISRDKVFRMFEIDFKAFGYKFSDKVLL